MPSTATAAGLNNCDKDRVERALMLIGEKEIDEMINEGKEIELRCHFCNKAYTFNVDELKEIKKRAKIKKES